MTEEKFRHAQTIFRRIYHLRRLRELLQKTEPVICVLSESTVNPYFQIDIPNQPKNLKAIGLDAIATELAVLEQEFKSL